MSAKSWTAIVTEKNSFLDVEFCDHDPQTEPLRRYSSEPDLAACWRHINGTCKSKCITMVNNFIGMPQEFNDDEASSNDFVSQRVSNMPGWHLRDFEDEELALLGNDPVPMANRSEDSRRSEDAELISFSSNYFVSMEIPLEDATLPRKKKSRPSRERRMRIRKFMEKMLRLLRNDPDNFELDKMDMPPSLAVESAHKTRLEAYVQSEKERILKDREIDRILAPLLVGQRELSIPSIGHFLG